MAIPSIGGGAQIGDGNTAEIQMGFAPTVTTQGTGALSITPAILLSGIIAGSPGTAAATYTMPTVAALEAVLVNAKVGSTFEFSIINVDGSSSGVITLSVSGATGWTLVGKATVGLVASGGACGIWRAIKTGTGTWTAYRIAG